MQIDGVEATIVLDEQGRVERVIDNSGGGHDLVQPNPALRPSVTTVVVGGRTIQVPCFEPGTFWDEVS